MEDECNNQFYIYNLQKNMGACLTHQKKFPMRNQRKVTELHQASKESEDNMDNIDIKAAEPTTQIHK